MNLKKKGQAALEYFILFAVLAVLAIYFLFDPNGFLHKIKDSVGNFSKEAGERIMAEPPTSE